MKDYEREEAQVWQVVEHTKRARASIPSGDSQPRCFPAENYQTHPQISQKSLARPQIEAQKESLSPNTRFVAAVRGSVKRDEPKGNLPDLAVIHDTARPAPFRKTGPPKLAFQIPKNILRRDDQGEVSTKTIVPQLDRISVRLGTNYELVSLKNAEYAVHVWGSPAAVLETRKQLKVVISKLLEENAKRTWAHVPSVLPKQRQIQEKRLEEDLKNQIFRDVEPTSCIFDYLGFFEWPVDEYDPEVVLGRNFEALNMIRIEQRCFITFDVQSSAFCVKGTDSARVMEALVMLRTTFLQILAQEKEKLPTLNIFERLSGDPTNSEVLFKPFPKLQRPNAIPKVTVELLKAQHDGQMKATDENKALTTARAKSKRAKASICRSLDTLQYFRGFLQMRARLGTFVLTKYKIGSRMSVADFEAMAAQEQFAATITPALESRILEDEIQTRFSHANKFLIPANADAKTLKDVNPFYTGIIVVLDPSNQNDVQIEARFTVESDAPVQVSMRCLRDSNSDENSSKFLDLNFVNLEKLLSWNLEISSRTPVDHKSCNVLSAFIDSIGLETKIATDIEFPRAGCFINFASTTLQVKSIQQRKTWRYILKDSSYVCEISATQDIPLDINSQPAPLTTMSPLETNTLKWALSVFHDSWDCYLGENSDLAVGKRVSWINDIETFFPTSKNLINGSNGFDDFIAMLQDLSTVVYGDS